MFSTIVVGTDGSTTAEAAVGLAIDLARQNGAVLHLVTVLRQGAGAVAVAAAGASAGADDRARQAVDREAADRILRADQARAEGVTVERHVASGSPADVLVDIAQQVGADLIVVGSKGMQGARRILGSVPNSVAHAAPCHVLIAKTA